MSYFVVSPEAGPSWTDGGIEAQPAIGYHAAFMNALADESFVLFAGPLDRTEQGRLRALLIVHADGEDEVRFVPPTTHGRSPDTSSSRASSHGISSSAARPSSKRAITA